MTTECNGKLFEFHPLEQRDVRAGFRVLAIGFRGEGQSRGGMPGHPPEEGRPFDVLAAVHYL